MTEREITIIRLVAQGKTNKEIAPLVGLGWRHLKNVLTLIFAACEVTSRQELTGYAYRNGLVDAGAKLTPDQQLNRILLQLARLKIELGETR